MFSFQQGLSGETLRLIAESCQNLKKLYLVRVEQEEDVINHVIDKLGKQLTSLKLNGPRLIDVVYSYLSNCEPYAAHGSPVASRNA